MTDLDLYSDLASRKLVASDGGAVTLPLLVLGDTLRCRLRSYERAESGDLRERDLRVRTLRAGIGAVMAAPVGGSFVLKVEDTTTPGTFHDSTTINFDANAATVNTALSAMVTPNGWTVTSVEAPTASCWIVRLGSVNAEPATLAVKTNLLSPTSFVRVRPVHQADGWTYEIRLIQAPLAFNDGHERVLPPAPNVRRVLAGRPESDTEPPLNELQDLHLPPDFRGTYFLRWNYRASSLLGTQDGPDEIAAALNAMFDDKNTRFAITNPEADHAYIEFVGDLAVSPQALITVEVNTFAPGTLTFDLSLERAEMAAALRSVATLDLSFELELEIVEDDQDPANPAIPGRTITLFQQPVKVVREEIWRELALVQSIDWLRPTPPRDYIPFTPDQIITGQQSYTAVFGDGEARSFSFPHNLATDNLAGIVVRENASGGHLRILGADYTLTFTSANELVLDVVEAKPTPALNALAIVITSAGPASVFQAHTHTMAQIIGLLDALAAVNARLTAIEDLLPSVTPGRLTDKGKSTQIEIPDKAEVYPGRFTAAGTASPDVSKLKPGGLLPAIHDATIADLAVPLPDVLANAGTVFVNHTGSDVPIPGGLGRRSSILKPGGFAASDGRVWYRVTHDGETNSFFPTDFERTPLPPLYINEQQFRAGGTFSLEFDLELQLVNATTNAQYLLVIETGTAPSQGTPDPTGTNLENLVWDAAPVLSQRLIVTALKLKHHFGCAFKRSFDGLTIDADRLLYDVWQGDAHPPISPSFALRVRLIQWDTENSVPGAKGLVSYRLLAAQASITNA